MCTASFSSYCSYNGKRRGFFGGFFDGVYCDDVVCVLNLFVPLEAHETAFNKAAVFCWGYCIVTTHSLTEWFS